MVGGAGQAGAGRAGGGRQGRRQGWAGIILFGDSLCVIAGADRAVAAVSPSHWLPCSACSNNQAAQGWWLQRCWMPEVQLVPSS